MYCSAYPWKLWLRESAPRSFDKIGLHLIIWNSYELNLGGRLRCFWIYPTVAVISSKTSLKTWGKIHLESHFCKMLNLLLKQWTQSIIALWSELIMIRFSLELLFILLFSSPDLKTKSHNNMIWNHVYGTKSENQIQGSLYTKQIKNYSIR